MAQRRSTAAPAQGRPVYAISVAAELTGTGVQSLRLYERVGLIEPSRTSGGTRRYSDADIARLRRVVDLATDGINLAGIAAILRLEDHIAKLRTENQRLRDQLDER
jgi:DNA-binding transcriptional MerR regulator